MNDTDNITRDIIFAMQNSTEIILEQTKEVSELRNKLSQISMAVGTLTHGQIPVCFISPNEMKRAVQEIDNVLREVYPFYRLAIKQGVF